MDIKPAAVRWPPIYDAHDLAITIKRLVESDQLTKQFYQPVGHLSLGPFQGDIIHLESFLPLIESDGIPAVTHRFNYWMVIGNTCDIDRDIKKVPWSQIVPLQYIGADLDLTQDELTRLKGYHYSRRFYVPAWSDATHGLHFVADFLRPVTIHKAAFSSAAKIEARLTYYSWILLHSCLVRFLARDDGRFG